MSEMAQLGHLKPVLAALGQGRKYSVRLAPMVWQDMGQMARVYGEHGATTILGNSGCVFAFAPGAVDNETAEFFSKAAGAHWVAELSAADDPQGGPARVNICRRSQSSALVLATGADSCSD
jgi:type IV secretory pathway TraG/TraD family ATPase VirD4